MLVYSSAFDARDYPDEEINTAAFLEFLFSVLFGSTICVNAGSLFDSEPFHLTWSSYYPSYERYAHKYRHLPLVIFVEQNRYRDIVGSREYFASLVARQFIGGRIRGLDGQIDTIPVENQNYNVAGRDSLENMRSVSQSIPIADWRSRTLGFLRNPMVAASIEALDAYTKRLPEVIRFYDEAPTDVLRVYMEAVGNFATAVREDDTMLSAELTRSLREIASTAPLVRGSTSALIATARQCFGGNYERIVRPIAKAVSANAASSRLSPHSFSNYEYYPIVRVGLHAFTHALTSSSYETPFSSITRISRRPIDIAVKRNIADVCKTYDWDAIHNVVLSDDYQRKLERMKEKRDARSRAEFLDHAATALVDTLPTHVLSEVRDEAIRIEIDTGDTSLGVAKTIRQILPAALKRDIVRRTKKASLQAVLDQVLAPST